ncbi:hypothetical protein Trydic_g540 [Trypoxylus dichotomus]
MTRKLIEEYEKWRLEVNLDKTEYMCIEGNYQDLEIEKEMRIRWCDEYKYLGVTISQDYTVDKANYEHNVEGRKAIVIVNGTLWDRNISKENKHQMYNTIVKSIITYGCEVWPIRMETVTIIKSPRK